MSCVAVLCMHGVAKEKKRRRRCVRSERAPSISFFSVFHFHFIFFLSIFKRDGRALEIFTEYFTFQFLADATRTSYTWRERTHQIDSNKNIFSTPNRSRVKCRCCLFGFCMRRSRRFIFGMKDEEGKMANKTYSSVEWICHAICGIEKAFQPKTSDSPFTNVSLHCVSLFCLLIIIIYGSFSSFN